jgi:hypothetical protein
LQTRTAGIENISDHRSERINQFSIGNSAGRHPQKAVIKTAGINSSAFGAIDAFATAGARLGF